MIASIKYQIGSDSVDKTFDHFGAAEVRSHVEGWIGAMILSYPGDWDISVARAAWDRTRVIGTRVFPRNPNERVTFTADIPD